MPQSVSASLAARTGNSVSAVPSAPPHTRQFRPYPFTAAVHAAALPPRQDGQEIARHPVV